MTEKEDKTFGFHHKNSNGDPSGGCSWGPGFTISWQSCPKKMDGVERLQNGADIEDVIDACIGRLEVFQHSRFESEYNRLAIEHLMEARNQLFNRTKDRESRGVEGKYEV